MNNFDIADFNANPVKYALFRTARIATKKALGFAKGECVAIEYVGNADDDDGQIVPVYAVTSANGTEYYLYANAFSNFVL